MGVQEEEEEQGVVEEGAAVGTEQDWDYRSPYPVVVDRSLTVLDNGDKLGGPRVHIRHVKNPSIKNGNRGGQTV